MSAGDGMPNVNYGTDPQGTWKRGVITGSELHAAMASPPEPKRRPLWARVVLTYSFGWFFAGEVVGILLLALALVLVKAL